MNERDFQLVEGNGNVFRDFGDVHADLKQGQGDPGRTDHRRTRQPGAYGEEARGNHRLFYYGFPAYPQRRSQAIHVGSTEEDTCRA